MLSAAWGQAGGEGAETAGRGGVLIAGVFSREPGGVHCPSPHPSAGPARRWTRVRLGGRGRGDTRGGAARYRASSPAPDRDAAGGQSRAYLAPGKERTAGVWGRGLDGHRWGGHPAHLQETTWVVIEAQSQGSECCPLACLGPLPPDWAVGNAPYLGAARNSSRQGSGACATAGYPPHRQPPQHPKSDDKRTETQG